MGKKIEIPGFVSVDITEVGQSLEDVFFLVMKTQSIRGKKKTLFLVVERDCFQLAHKHLSIKKALKCGAAARDNSLYDLETKAIYSRLLIKDLDEYRHSFVLFNNGGEIEMGIEDALKIASLSLLPIFINEKLFDEET